MSGKHKHERRMQQMRRALDASPLPAEEQARLREDAAYLLARLRGEAARPPAHWPAEQVAAFAALLADPNARSALLNELLAGFQRLHARVDTLPDE